MQNFFFTLPNISLFGPDKLCLPYLDNFLRLHFTTEVCSQLAKLVYPGVLLSGLGPSTGTEIEPVLIWWTPLAPTWWLTEILPHATWIPPEALPMTDPSRQRQVEVDLGLTWDFCWSTPRFGAGGSWFWCTAWFFYEHTGPAEAATNYASLCSTKQVTWDQSQAVSHIDLHQRPSQETPEPTHPVPSFRHQSRI